MAEQIDELFVKLGLDTDEKEFQQANEQFANLRTNALQFGAALGTVGAAGFGLVNNFAGRTDELGQFADRMDVSAQFVNQLGFALESVGGSADDAFGSIENMLSILQDQDWGQLEGKIESLSAGIDFQALKSAATEADSLREAYVDISEQIQGLSGRKQQRVLEELGFTGEQMNLLQLGPEEMQARFQRGAELAPVTDEMTESARRFNEAMNELETQTRGIADIMGNRLAPALTQAINALVEAGGRESFEQAYEEGIGFMRRQFEAFGGLAEGDIGGFVDTMMGNVESAVGTGILNFMPGPVGSILQGMDFGRSVVPSADGGDGSAMPETIPLSPRRGGGVPPEVRANPDTSMNTGPRVQNNFQIDARGATDPEGVAQNVEGAVSRVLSRYAENTILDVTGGVS
jgi:hypothetical protein